jgi:hypothetical protein
MKVIITIKCGKKREEEKKPVTLGTNTQNVE